MSHLQINFAFRLFWSILGEIHWKFLFLIIKLTLSERSSDIIGKFVFLNKLEKGKIHRKIWIICKQNLLYEAIKWDIYKQKKFLHKMNHIQLNYAFLLFWSTFGEIHWKILFLFKNWLSQKEAQKYKERMLFSPRF